VAIFKIFARGTIYNAKINQLWQDFFQQYRTYAQDPEKKLERVFWMNQIFRDGRFDNHPFCIVDRDVIDAVNDLKSDESPE